MEIVRRDFANVPPQEAYRFLDYTLGSTSTPGAWRVASAAFRAAGGLAAGLQYPFLGYRLMTGISYDHTAPQLFHAHATYRSLEAGDRRFLYALNDAHMENAVHWRKIFD